MYSFYPVEYEAIDVYEFNNFENKSLFTTKEWINYIIKDSGAKPVIIKIEKGNKKIGYFSGLIFTKFGIKILASPFSGWSTCYMGLDLNENENRMSILLELKDFLFKEYHCMYIEIIDREITVAQAQELGIGNEHIGTLELEIKNKSDEQLFKVFKTDCRNFIRQFERRGAVLEVAEPNDEFAEEYYEQLKDVFAKQHLVPTYGLQKVKNLLGALRETDKVLCLRVRNPQGESIATSIFVGYKKKFFFWGGASYRKYQSYRPNEYMIWYAIKYWRNKGAEVFDMVGVRDYKKKFGPVEKEYAQLAFPKYKILLTLRNCAKELYYFKGKIIGKIECKK